MDWAIFAVVILFFSYLGISGRKYETQKFNNGVCPKCATALVHFDNDSQGGRGYTCRDCDYVVWVSWPSVDRTIQQKRF